MTRTVGPQRAASPEQPLTLVEVARLLRTGRTSSVELTRAALTRADDCRELGTFVTRFDDDALARAERADRDFQAGVDHGLLQGIPVGVKDLLAAAEGPTTANSVVLDRSWGQGRDAPVVGRLKRAGAVVVGKTTTFEFAAGLPEEGRQFPIPRNAWDSGRSPGGSSSGAGNGVASGQFLAAIGTDSVGSIRIPAAWNGISGLKPTFGLVPTSGCVPLGYSFDHVGPLARSARDCAAVLRAITGPDDGDPGNPPGPPDGDGLSALLQGRDADLRGLRVGVDRHPRFTGPDADPDLETRFVAALGALEALGARIVDISLPWYDAASAALLVMLSGEALAYHRGDLQSRWQDYLSTTRVSFARGALASAADYVQASRVRRLVQRELAGVFGGVDVVVTPTVSIPAPTIEEMQQGGIDRLYASIFTGYWNLTGSPVLAVPMGFAAAGLPLSFQIAGRPFEDATVLRVGDAYQQATDWHLRIPSQDRKSIGQAGSTPPDLQPVPVQPGAADALAGQLIAAAGIVPEADETAALAASYPLLKASIESLYAIPEARYETPSLSFDAAPGRADW